MEIKVLDHGYVRFIEAWGGGSSMRGEAAIIEAARMSTAKGFNGWSCWKCLVCGAELENTQSHTSSPGVMCQNGRDDTAWERTPRDEKLLAFLYNNQHMTPFEMAGMTIEVAAPIFVFREWHRHRVPFGYNEMSARYVALPNEEYMPQAIEVVRRSARAALEANRQAAGTGRVLTTDEVLADLELMEQHQKLTEELYQRLLTRGWPRELARIRLPVARYSRMRATSNLRGWLSFLTLRMASNAQWEIRQYANAVGEIISKFFPKTWKLFFHDEE